MSIFALKIIACITMILDHIKYAIPETNNFFTMYFGRISFPLFAFLVTEGYIHTKNLKKYYKRLIIFAIISQIPFMLFRTLVGEYKMLNIMFTLLLGLLSITVYDNNKNKLVGILACLPIICMGEICNVDYGGYGVTTVLIFYIFRKRKILSLLVFSLVVLLQFYTKGVLNNFNIYVLFNYIFTVSSCVFILLYNGKQGRKLKYFYYLFYPIHMLILYFVSMI